MKRKKSVFLLVILVLILSGCTDSVVGQKTEFVQNEKAITDYFEIQITNVHTSYDNGSFLLEDGYLFVVVDVTIKNISKEKQTVSTSGWKLQNSNGLESDTSMLSKFANETFSAELLANGTINGVLYFEQPLQNSGLKLAYYGSYFDKEPVLTFSLTTDCSAPILKTEPYAKTEKVVFSDLEYSIDSTKTSKGKNYTKPAAGKIFLGVTMNAANISKYDSIDVTTYDWKIVDSNGTSYDTTYRDPWDSDYFSSTTVDPLGKFSWFMVFEVPSNSKWYLTYYGSMFSETKKFSILLN